MKDEKIIQTTEPRIEEINADEPEKIIPAFTPFILRPVAAVAFLTRLPMPKKFAFGAADVGRATLFFPLVGAIIGAIQIIVFYIFQSAARESDLRAVLAAILVVIGGAFITGALHFDGLADMADGFGGGRDKESVLRIMRDSLIGSYGATALILILLLKVTAIAVLIGEGNAVRFLILAPVLARWTSVPVGKFMPYARKEGGLGQSITDFVGWTELLGATFIALFFAFLILDWKQTVAVFTVIGLLTALNALWSWRKIGGVTGDTMGANTEICETAVLLTAVWLKL